MLNTVIMKENVEDMRRRGIRVPVVLGGAALTRSFVERDCSRAYGLPVAYGKDAFAGLAFMDRVAQRDGHFTTPVDPVEAPALPGPRPLPEHELDLEPVLSVAVPEPPFLGSRLLEEVPLRSVAPFVNEGVLFKHQWGFLKKGMSTEEHAEQLSAVVRPLYVNLLRRCETEHIMRPQAVYGFFLCQPEGQALRLEDGTTLNFPRQVGGGRCLTDWFHPDGDVVGLMAVTVGQRASDVAREWFEANDYTNYLYLHGLGVELAEALAEYAHRRMRVDLGIADQDPRQVTDLFRGRYRGARFSYGYPACPEMADQAHILRLLGADRIGLRMDDDEQMHPEQSTAALVLHHPQARYFKVQ